MMGEHISLQGERRRGGGWENKRQCNAKIERCNVENQCNVKENFNGEKQSNVMGQCYVKE